MVNFLMMGYGLIGVDLKKTSSCAFHIHQETMTPKLIVDFWACLMDGNNGELIDFYFCFYGGGEFVPKEFCESAFGEDMVRIFRGLVAQWAFPIVVA